MTLTDLRAAFLDARTQAAASARYTTASCPPDTCRYCGKHLRLWPQTRLDGHARCFVDKAFLRAVYSLWLNDTKASRHRIAEVCDVSHNVVNAWIRHVEDRMEKAA